MILPDGSPVPNAKVVLGDSSNALAARTGPEGQFVVQGIPSGLHSVWVRREGITETVVRGIRIENENTPPIEIVVEPGGVLSGKVVDTDGRGVQGIEVAVSSYELQKSELGPARTTVRTDAEGTFRFDTLWGVSYTIVTEAKVVPSASLAAVLLAFLVESGRELESLELNGRVALFALDDPHELIHFDVAKPLELGARRSPGRRSPSSTAAGWLSHQVSTS